MKKSKLDNKTEKAGNLFTINDFPRQPAALSTAESISLDEIEEETNVTHETQAVSRWLTEVVLFLPGTFLLFFMSYASVLIFMEIFIYQRDPKSLPDDFVSQLVFVGLFTLLGIFMTWAGLGDLKNKKHCAIPASVMITGAAVGVIIKVAASFSAWADKLLDDFDHLIYLLPLALIIPVLAKGFVERDTEMVDK